MKRINRIWWRGIRNKKRRDRKWFDKWKSSFVLPMPESVFVLQTEYNRLKESVRQHQDLIFFDTDWQDKMQIYNRDLLDKPENSALPWEYVTVPIISEEMQKTIEDTRKRASELAKINTIC